MPFKFDLMPLWLGERHNVNNLRISLGQDGDGFLRNTIFNDSLLRSATENRWDRHFILINTPNGFAHKTKLFLQWCMRVCLSLSYFQVDNAHTNPSRLTVIIRIIRRADISDEFPRWMLSAEQNDVRRVSNVGNRTQQLGKKFKFSFRRSSSVSRALF